MSTLEVSAAGIAWMVICMLAVYAANWAVTCLKKGLHGQAYGWCLVCALLFMLMFGTIPFVWHATCGP